MKPSIMIGILGTTLLAGSAGLAQEAAPTAEELQARLEGVAPPDVLENATLVHVGEGGEMQTLREGTNGWTCMYPGTDPMCADANATEFVHAYMAQEEPPETVGFVYMLLGDEGASNTDPYATEETADNEWVVAGPHVMIVGAGAGPLIESYPQEVPEGAGQPWVMWPDTPYAHLMLPVE